MSTRLPNGSPSAAYVGQFTRDAEADEADTMVWGTDTAFRNCEETPAAVIDDCARGSASMIRLLADEAASVLSNLRVRSGET